MNAAIIFFVSCFFIFLIVAKTRSLKSQGKNKQIRYHFLKSTLEFLFPFAFVMMFYSVLIIFASYFWDLIGFHSLIKIEDYLEHIYSVTKWKLGIEIVLPLFIGIYALGLLRVISLKKRIRLYSAIDNVSKWTKRIYILFVFLCSFTILGTQLGDPSNDIKIRLKLIRDGYADIYNKTNSAISEEVAFQLYNKSTDAFPANYQSALKLTEKIGSDVGSLSSKYSHAQKEYNIKSIETESILKATNKHLDTISNLRKDITIQNEQLSDNLEISDGDLQGISCRKIKKAKDKIKAYIKNTRSKVINILSTEDGKRLSIQGAKVMSNVLKSELFSQWIKEYPIVEPVIDVFIKTADETSKSKIEEISKKSTFSIIEHPEKTQSIVVTEASKIVDDTKIKVSPEIIEKANKRVEQIAALLERIKESSNEIDTKIKDAEDTKIEEFIAQLSNSDKSIRVNGANNLSKMGKIIEREKINKIINIMRTGKKEWETDHNRPSGHHCTDYEYTSIRYYAATAINGMDSQFVTESIRNEAKGIKRSSVRSERVTDPGWV